MSWLRLELKDRAAHFSYNTGQKNQVESLEELIICFINSWAKREMACYDFFLL